MQPMQPQRGGSPGASYQPGTPPSSMTPASTRPAAPADARVASSNQYLRTPIIRYSSRMRMGKLHRLSVTLTGNEAGKNFFSSPSGGFEPPMVVQASVPGALVTPPHVILPLNGGEAVFYVQPLTTGKLMGAKVEFLSQGRRIGEVPLPMRANRGRWAKWLLFLAIVLPILVYLVPKPVFVDPAPYDPSGGRNAKPAASKSTKTGPMQAPFSASPKKPGKTNSESKPGKTNGKTNPLPNEKSIPEKVNPEKSNTAPPKAPAKDAPPPVTSLPRAATTDLLATSWLVSNITLLQDSPPPSKENASPVPKSRGIRYEGEDAISAWIRNVFINAGYAVTVKEDLSNVDTGPMSFSQKVADTLYTFEPAITGAYRFLIVAPQTFPFGVLAYFFLFLLLAALAWLLTKPNRVKLKGPLMDIRVGG